MSYSWIQRFSLRFSALLGLLVFALLTTACGSGTEEGGSAEAPTAEAGDSTPLVIYSGRNQSLVGDLLAQFEEATGQAVEVRYGGTAEFAATLLEEGEGTPCDVFIAQDAGALGAVDKAGLFQALPQNVLDRVPARFRSPAGTWVGLSGRARTVVYNTERVTPEDLPQSLEDVTDERYRGRFGVAPANASFQAHMAVYRAVHGAEALGELLAGMVANEPRRYPKNSAIVEAVIQGEVDWGLVNHYYLWRALDESPDAPGKNFTMPGEASGGVASFINLAGAGQLSERPEALELVRFLLSSEAQSYFAQNTFEYPLVDGVEPAVELAPMAEAVEGQLDFTRVGEELPATLEQIASSGLLQ